MRQSWNGRYSVVSISSGGTQKTHTVHVLICSAFHGPKPAGFVCRHKDDDSFNNRPSNLHWGTIAENNRERVRSGRMSGSKIFDWQAAEIRAYRHAGVSMKALATAYGLSVSGIKHVVRGRTHIYS